MEGKGRFAEYANFLKDHSGAVCGFLLLVQRESVENLCRFSFRTHPKATEVGDILTAEQLLRVHGYGQHKRNLARTAAEKTEEARRPKSVFPVDDRVACVTMHAAHTCQQLSVGVTPPADLASAGAAVGESDGVDMQSDCASLTSLTSAAGLLRQQLVRATNRGPSARSIAATLQESAAAGERVDELSFKHLSGRVAAYGVRAPAMVKNVRRVVVGAQAVDEATLNKILQAGVAEARADGDYAEIIEASGSDVRERAIELARAYYNYRQRKKLNGRKGSWPKFDPDKANIASYPDADEQGNEIRSAVAAAASTSVAATS